MIPANKSFLSLILAILLFSLSACSNAAAPNSGEPELSVVRSDVVVVMGPSSEPAAGFDPAYGWGAGEHVHEPLIQSTLTVTTPDLKIANDLATDISVSEDGMTWTVAIRNDVLFSDGNPLTARDVAFTYNTVKATSSVNDFTMLDSAEAAGDYTVVFHMERPYSIWPYTMAIVGVVPEHAYGPDYGQKPVGSGRYLLRQWDKGQQIIFEANPDYYGEAPRIRKVTVLFMSEDAALAAVMAGQADLAYTAASYAEQSIEGYGLLSVASVDNRGLNLPAIPHDGEKGNDVTADPAVRRAVNIGLDRETLINNVMDGHGAPAYSVCDAMPWFSPDMIVDFDRQGAIGLLEQAGWLAGADGVRVKDGVRAALNILYPAGDSLRQAIAAEAAGQLGELGIDAAFEGVGWDVAYDRAQSEVMTWGWGAHTPMELYNIYHTDPDTGLARYSPYADAEADKLMDEALAAPDLEAAYGLWRKAQANIARDVPWVWLCNVNHLYWARNGLAVAEQKIHPHGHGWSIVNNVDQWHWELGGKELQK